MYKIIVAAFIVFVLANTWRNWLGQRMSWRRLLMAHLLWAGVLLASFFPQWTDPVTQWLGVTRGADLALFFTVIFLVYVVLQLHTRLETQRMEMTGLVRRIALREMERDTLTDDGGGTTRDQ